MKIEMSITLDVDWCDDDLGSPKPGDPLHDRVAQSVEEAVINALDRAVADGFAHDMEDMLSITNPTIMDVRLVP